ncbi:transcriptional regulator YeiL [Solibacillus sp. R5-41]|nr:transcriptional regulator YeiL [Solibacillus sp. R5-41]ATP41235.1 transcriptional regulator YeiL [Solibacillus sp. R5-41]
MKVLTNKLRKFYIEKYPINQLFSVDMTPYLAVHQFEKGEFIFKERSHPEYLYYMVEGKAKLYVTHKNGKVSLIDFITSPIFMGEIELIDGERVSKGIQTVTKTICLAIPIQQCKKQLLTDVIFLRELCMFLSDKAMKVTAKYTQNQVYPLENRLAAFILLSSDHDFYKEKHTEICEFLGVSYRHLLYTLAAFCEAGILVKHNRGYLIQNKDKLRTLSEEVL